METKKHLRKFTETCLVYLVFVCSLPPFVLSSDTTFRIGAFNIQVFGSKKVQNEDSLEVMGRIIRRYDIVLIQEIRDSSGTSINKLMEVVNSAGYSYTSILSDRLGRTRSKEQYAFLFRDNGDITVKSSYKWALWIEELSFFKPYVLIINL